MKLHTQLQNQRPFSIWLISSIAALFGMVTIKAGGSVLFFDGPAREAAGNYVQFVVGANFIMGFFYILAGIGIWLQKPCSLRIVAFLTSAILTVYAALGIHILMGRLYEMETVYVMAFRSLVWISIYISLRKISKF